MRVVDVYRLVYTMMSTVSVSWFSTY